MSRKKICLASDNWVPAHPLVIKAVVEANEGYAPSYGADPWTEKAEHVIQDLFKRPCKVFTPYTSRMSCLVGVPCHTRSTRSLQNQSGSSVARLDRTSQMHLLQNYPQKTLKCSTSLASAGKTMAGSIMATLTTHCSWRSAGRTQPLAVSTSLRETFWQNWVYAQDFDLI